MEIEGTGSAIVECPRIGRMIADHGEVFLCRVYTGREIRVGQSRTNTTAYFAGRWAAKEAIFRALGAGPGRGIGWLDVEIRDVGGGRSRVHVGGKAKDALIRMGIGEVLVSIARCRTYATAHAVALRAPSPP